MIIATIYIIDITYQREPRAEAKPQTPEPARAGWTEG